MSNDEEFQQLQAAYLAALERRGEDAAGAWHTAFRAVEDSLILFVRDTSAAHEQLVRDAFGALRVASATRQELLIERVTHIVNDSQLRLLAALERVEAHEARTAELIERRFDEIALRLDTAVAERRQHMDALRGEVRVSIRIAGLEAEVAELRKQLEERQS